MHGRWMKRDLVIKLSLAKDKEETWASHEAGNLRPFVFAVGCGINLINFNVTHQRSFVNSLVSIKYKSIILIAYISTNKSCVEL